MTTEERNAARHAHELRLGGMTPWSSVDYPGHMAATIFCGGCPWRCRYCHNHNLQPPTSGLSWATVRDFLKRREGLLEAVVVSGGEPLAQAGALRPVLREIHAMGLKTALHTAGVTPRRLEHLLPDLDWVGFDVKAPFEDYAAITGRARSGQAARAALHLLLASGKDHEIRTTVHPQLLPETRLIVLVQDLASMGVTDLVLQPFRPQGCPDVALARGCTSWLHTDLHQTLRSLMPTLRIRDLVPYARVG